MILLGILLALLLLVAGYAILGSGIENTALLFNAPALACVLLFVMGYVILRGTKLFRTGLSALWHRPRQHQPEVSDYFQNLALYTLAFGINLAFLLAILSMYSLGGMEMPMFTSAIHIFFFSTWLTLLFFVPTAYRFSGGELGIKLRRTLYVASALGFCFLVPVFAGMCLLYLQIDFATGLKQFKDYNLLTPLLWIDIPSLIAVLGTLIACRLAMGKLQCRHDWIPIALLVGVLWTLIGATLMMANFAPNVFAPACLVAAIPTIYACIFALAVLVNRFWFFTLSLMILGLLYMLSYAVLDAMEPESSIASVVWVVLLVTCSLCWFGCLLDWAYYFLVQHERSAGLFRKRKLAWGVVLCGPLVIVPLFVGMALTFQGSRNFSRCAQCTENMRQIGIALRHYHDEHGSFPPAFTVCEEGKPLHSWRTLILPHFEPAVIESKWKEIYEQIRFDEPWDSEHNLLFSQSIKNADAVSDYQRFRYDMPATYGCPMCCSGASEAQTPYKMIVGDNAIGNLTGTSLSQIERPVEETILLIESGAPVSWMSPSDFAESDFQTAVFANDRKQVNEIRIAYYTEPSSAVAKRQFLGGKHSRELHILFADGTVKTFLDGELPLSEIERMGKMRE